MKMFIHLFILQASTSESDVVKISEKIMGTTVRNGIKEFLIKWLMNNDSNGSLYVYHLL